MNKYKKKDVYNNMPKFDDASGLDSNGSKNVRMLGEPSEFINLVQNQPFELMWIKTHVRKLKVKTFVDSGSDMAWWPEGDNNGEGVLPEKEYLCLGRWTTCYPCWSATRLNKAWKGKVLVLLMEVQVSYFEPLIGTRNTDPEYGLLYETVEVKMNRKGYIAAFRKVVTQGKVTGYKDGPIYMVDITRITDVDLNYLSSLVGRVQLNTAPSEEDEGGRTEVDFTIEGNDDDDELYTSPGLHGHDNSINIKGSTTHDVIADSYLNPKKRCGLMVGAHVDDLVSVNFDV
jgi:hypothetical protein